MNRICLALRFVVALSLLSGCDNQVSGGPPTVRLGDSVCVQCNMIISDERWATATMVEGPRGPEARLFDDFNCQVNYEVENPDVPILARWSRSHATREWVRTEDAHFLISPNLRTPMASKVAAFASLSEADEANAELTGDVVSFEAAWRHLGFAGRGN
jgi:nitrous oxide reductase accessory protein NosL